LSKFGAKGWVLRRGAGSRYPLLYQKPFQASLRRCSATSLQCLSAPRCFWYNATIEAILHGFNAIGFLLISNVYINYQKRKAKNYKSNKALKYSVVISKSVLL